MADRPTLARRALAEGIGTFALVLAGCGAIVTDAQRDGALGVVGIGLVFLLVLLAAIAALGHISGGQLGAVTYQFIRGEHPRDPLDRQAEADPRGDRPVRLPA